LSTHFQVADVVGNGIDAFGFHENPLTLKSKIILRSIFLMLAIKRHFLPIWCQRDFLPLPNRPSGEDFLRG